MDRVLILGISSFAGSSFANYLSKNYMFKLFGTYNSIKNINKLIFKKNNCKIKLVKIDLSSKKNTLLTVVKNIKPKYIFDFASVCLVNESWFDPKYYFKVNVESKIELVQNLHNLKFLKKFIYVSTPEVFGSTKHPVKEKETFFNPTTPYAISKLSVEKLLLSYSNFFGSKAIITRFSNFYGRGQLIHRLIPKVLWSIKNNKKFPIQGTGLSKRDFIFDQDFNSGLVKVLKKGKTGETYHFSNNAYYSIKDIISLICKIKKVPFKKLVYFTKDRIGKDKNYYLDCKKTTKELLWKPRIKIQEGLKQTINYYEKVL
jgi:dTDP-glucose 4,6-dehydratase|tara:strand:- start:7673 stop:8617 length:945 start_codon:yes stop_codon:yes gene_type:complete